MATGWFLLVVVAVVSSLSVDVQAMVDDTSTTVFGGELLNQLKRDMDMDNQKSTQQLILEQLQKLVKREETHRSHDCADIYNSGEHSNGVYTIYVGNAQRPVEVSCDMITDGGGWTVFQRRLDGSQSFYREWTDYAAGFGNLTGEFWLGNDNLHLLTSGECQELRVDLTDREGNRAYATYNNFRVAPGWQQYKLISTGRYSGNAGDSLRYHVGQKFSTRDRDNDASRGNWCAILATGAWWYNNCLHSNLNGQYLYGSNTPYASGLIWKTWKGFRYSLRATEMKIRPCDF